MVKAPMKAPTIGLTDTDLDNLLYPVYGSPKFDGFRCLTDNKAYTSSLKLIQNQFIQKILSKPEYAGLDGEIVIGDPTSPDAFNNTTGPVRRADGKPDFRYYVFDTFRNTNLNYEDRLVNLIMRYAQLPFVVVVEQTVIKNAKKARDYIAWCLEQGYEGAMLRSLRAPYKEGRATAREAYIFKVKPFDDDEAEIVGFVEQQENLNEKTTNELGRSTRSSHKDNKRGKDTLGKLILRTKNKKLAWYGKDITCGCGRMTHAQAQEIWDNKKKYLSCIGTYKYQTVGSIDMPRLPIWKGFRDKNDMTNY